MTQIGRGLMQRQHRGCRPELKLVTVTLAAMATVASDRHVHRERAVTPGRGVMQRTTSAPLHSRSCRGLEPEQVQDLLHRDLRANPVEVDAGHGCSSLADGAARCARTVPFQLYRGNGNDPPRWIGRGAAIQ